MLSTPCPRQEAHTIAFTLSGAITLAGHSNLRKSLQLLYLPQRRSGTAQKAIYLFQKRQSLRPGRVGLNGDLHATERPGQALPELTLKKKLIYHKALLSVIIVPSNETRA